MVICAIQSLSFGSVRIFGDVDGYATQELVVRPGSVPQLIHAGVCVWNGDSPSLYKRADLLIFNGFLESNIRIGEAWTRAVIRKKEH
jgi:hypothetical protein